MTTRILSFLALILLGLTTLGCGRLAAFKAFTQGTINYLAGEYDHYDQAVADYTRAIELDPEFSAAYYNRGRAYAERGQVDQAVADYTKVIELNPKDAYAYYYRGVANDLLDLLDQAIADYTQAIELEPKMAKAYLGRGLVLKQKRLYSKAIEDFETYLRLDPWAEDRRQVELLISIIK